MKEEVKPRALSWLSELLPVFMFRWLAKFEARVENCHFELDAYYITARKDILIKIDRKIE